ncbi:hypothetical protein [Glutamicibacter sp. BW77]|uniref:hypothetical protein n=1 Tax=Glutamicibacter sp. BW77 TaxID=2024402 RepID=UPI00114169D4|nr:hypothetical protein [Glutamicibacter sp. BW77]
MTSQEKSVFAEVQDAGTEVKRNGIAPAKPKGTPACYAMTQASPAVLHPVPVNSHSRHPNGRVSPRGQYLLFTVDRKTEPLETQPLSGTTQKSKNQPKNLKSAASRKPLTMDCGKYRSGIRFRESEKTANPLTDG